MLICPLCSFPLTREAAVLRCPNNHSFDIARDGYVNLLRQRIPAQAGDTHSMLAARRRFLDHGHYAPLARAITRAVLSHLADHDLPGSIAPSILDAGCGDGYYIAALAEALARPAAPVPAFPSAAEGLSHRCYGADLSKDALRLAARRYPSISFVAADIWKRLPFADASLHVLLDIFAPRNAAEFARLLAPSSLLLIVIPGDNHLCELRGPLHLLGIEQHKESHIASQLSGAFSLRRRETLAYSLLLTPADLADLVAMTPHPRRPSASPTTDSSAITSQATSQATRPTTATASFTLLAFERAAS